jgi:hypothetical protein
MDLDSSLPAKDLSEDSGLLPVNNYPSPPQTLCTDAQNVAASTVALIKISGVARLKGLHYLGEIAARSLQNQMHVIAKKTVRQKSNIFFTSFFQTACGTGRSVEGTTQT